MAAVPQLLSESEKHNLTPVIGCLPKGTPIITKLRIKTVEQIKVGDEVLTHRGRFKKVLNTSTRKFKGRMYEIKLSDSKFHTKGFLLTEEHPVLIRDKDGNVNFRLPPDILSGRPTTKRGINEWNSYVCFPKTKSATNCIYVENYLPNHIKFNGDDLVKIARKKRESNFIWKNFPKIINLDYDFVRLLGLFCAEGSTAKSTRNGGDPSGVIVFSFNYSELDTYVDEVVRTITRIFPSVKPIVFSRPERNLCEVLVRCVPLAYLFRSLCGIGSKNKFVPEVIFESFDEIKEEFLSGLFDGDAKNPENDVNQQATLRTSSIDLAYGVKRLLADLSEWVNVVRCEEQNKICYNVPYSPRRSYSRFISDSSYVYKPIREIKYSYEEVDAEIRQLGTELKQQHVEAVKKFRELRSRGNVLKGELAGQLGDNTARKRAEAKLAAKGRLANGDQLPPIDAPLDQVRMSNEYGNFLANVAKDMLIASDVPLLDSSEMSTTDQLINAMRTGRTTVPQLDEVAKRYGLKDTVELFERFCQFGSAAGRDLNIFARQQREINKLRGLSPELDDWINSRPPTMQEIDAIANGPSIARQLVNLNIGATIAQLATQTPNVVTGLVNATGVRSIINLADQVIERAIGSKRELTGGPGEPSKFEQNSVPPLSTVLAPVFAASTVVKDILSNPYWFAHGQLKDGTLNNPTDGTLCLVRI
jgi:intein/homing endonuclease